MTTIICFPALQIGFYYFQLQIQFEKKAFDSYDGHEFKQSERQNMINERMKAFVGLIFLFCWHTYLTQKDLITSSIQKHMIARQ
jgi:hypothetical protein